MRHRGAGGDDVVDHQHPPVADVGTGPEHGAGESFPAGPPGLRAILRGAIEQTPHGQPELGADVTGQQFALVEAALPAPGGAGGSPRDHVDPRVIAAFDDLVDDEAGEVPADATPVAVLQTEDHVARPSGERHGRMDTMGLGSGHPPDEGESTGDAHRCTRGITSGTTCHEQHVLHHDEGV